MADSYYQFSRVEDADDCTIYSFITPANTVYAVTFDPFQYINYIDRYPNLLEHGVGFSIYRISEKNEQRDIRIKNTIVQITRMYLSDSGTESVLLYHCDYQYGRQKKRSLSFQRWYNTSLGLNKLNHHCLEVFDTNTRLQHYMGCLLDKANPKNEIIQEEFARFGHDLNVEKQW